MKKISAFLVILAFLWAMPVFAQGALGSCGGLAGLGGSIGGVFGGWKGAVIGSSSGCGTGLLIYKFRAKGAEGPLKTRRKHPAEKQQRAEQSEATGTAPDLSGYIVALKFGNAGYYGGIPQIITDHVLHTWSGMNGTFFADPGTGYGYYNQDPCRIPNRKVVCVIYGPGLAMNGNSSGGNVYVQPGGGSNINLGSSGDRQQVAVTVTVVLYDFVHGMVGPQGRLVPTTTYLASLTGVSNAANGYGYLNGNVAGRGGYNSYANSYSNPQLAYLAAAAYATDELANGNGWLPNADATLAQP